VYSPHRAVVRRIVDGCDDNESLGPPDRASPAGNYVLLDCPRMTLLLAHLKRGSIRVRAGDLVEAGDFLGLAGNSGNSSEPHLHVHAERVGIGIGMEFGGRYLIRNSIIKVA